MTPTPLKINLKRTESLQILWSDGLRNCIPLADLRKACPCATCRADQEEQEKSALRVVPQRTNAELMATAETVELVGQYALRMIWRDGHNTGIYGYALLRSLAALESAD